MVVTALIRYVQVKHSLSLPVNIVDVAPGIKICRDAGKVHLRAVSRGALNALAALPPRHEAAKRDLALVTGAVAFLMQARRAIRRRAIRRAIR